MEISKSIPIALISGLVVQGAAIVWTASMMSSNIQNNSENIDQLAYRLNKVEEAVHAQEILVARIDENIKAIRTFVERIEPNDQRASYAQ